MNSIDFLIGPSRSYPYALTDRSTPPSGTAFPRPFDIKHSNKAIAGRSTGGFYHLNDFETMEWQYTVGITDLYQASMAIYNPVNPWVWIYFFDLYENDGAWWEAALQEPRVERGGANVIGNLSLIFTRMMPYGD